MHVTVPGVGGGQLQLGPIQAHALLAPNKLAIKTSGNKLAFIFFMIASYC